MSPVIPESRELQEDQFYRNGGNFRWCWPRFIICNAADRPPLAAWNRYPHNVIGAAFRLKGRSYLSIVWKKNR